MNKFNVSQIKNKAAIYYAVGIALFSAIAVVLVTLVILVDLTDLLHGCWLSSRPFPLRHDARSTLFTQIL